MLSGGIVLASGDAFLLVQTAGTGTTFSYTASADLVIVHWGFDNASTLRLGTYVANTSGNYNYGFPQSAGASSTYQNGQDRLILKSGQTITASHSNINTYGIVIGGFEL